MNIKSNLIFLFIFVGLVFLNPPAWAQDSANGSGIDSETEIEDTPTEQPPETLVKEVVVSDDELPSESVIPITDNTSSVLNKKIRYTKRFQIDLNTGSVLDEAIVNANYFLIRASYYTNEEYSFGAGMRSRFGGKTTYSEQLYQGSAPSYIGLNFDLAPVPTSAQFVSFGYNFYYGKISLGKNIVIPASTKLESDFGLQSFNSSNKPFLQSAVNQSFYIGTHLSLGFSIGLSMAQVADPTSVSVRLSAPVPNEGSFSDKIQFNQFLSVNLNLLL